MNPGDDFGEWRVGRDGLAHFILAGKCLCSSRLDVSESPPLKMTEGTTLVTPLCKRCLDLNARRMKMSTR